MQQSPKKSDHQAGDVIDEKGLNQSRISRLLGSTMLQSPRVDLSPEDQRARAWEVVHEELLKAGMRGFREGDTGIERAVKFIRHLAKNQKRSK